MVGSAHGDEEKIDASQTNSQRATQQVTLVFSHLASTVPDSQDLQQATDVSTSCKPLAPLTAPQPSKKIPSKKMASQGSLHDTQELSPSYYARIINANKGKNAQESSGFGFSQDVDDGITQRTVHTGDPGHIDLGLNHGSYEDDEAQTMDAELDSEPVAFSPTQVTQGRLSQFPESQRFKTPATHGKKRNYDGEIIGSPDLPRNPLVRSDEKKTPMYALGLSQAFAATQAGSSPFIARHISEPASDRPSPNIEMHARLATSSFSSPLRRRSELKRISAEPQARYVSLKQSQAERERLAALRQQSPDAMAAAEQTDDDFDEEPSPVKLARRLRRREENIRQQFARFSSPSHPGSMGKTADRPGSTARAETSSPSRTHNRRSRRPSTAEKDATLVDGLVAGDSEDETDVEQEHQVIIRHSSQVARANDEEDKENVQARPLQVPDTIARLNQVVDALDERYESPTLRGSFAPPPVQPALSAQTLGQGFITDARSAGSPTFAIANSQPDLPLARKLVPQLIEPTKIFSDGLHVSSSATGATQVESSPYRDHGQHHDHQSKPLGAVDEVVGAPRCEDVHEGSGNGLQSEESSVAPPRGREPVTLNKGIDVKLQAEPLSTVSEMTSGQGSATNAARGPLEVMTTSVNGIGADQQSSRYETAQTHRSSSTQRPLNPLFSSPSGRIKKRLGDIAAQPSPKKIRGEAEVEEVIAVLDDAEFYNAVERAPGSSSPIPPGRKASRRRLVGGQAISGRATSASADAELHSSPPTHDLPATSHPLDQTQSVSSSRTHPRPARSFDVIWDVQTSPPRSEPGRSMRSAAKGPKGSSRSPLNPQVSKPTRKEVSTRRRPQDDSDQEPRPVQRVRKPSETATAMDEAPPFLSTEVIAPSQVLARFNGNPRGYFPASCVGFSGLKSDGTFRYRIRWDDSSYDEIDEDGIRRLDLRIGDQVKLNLQDWPRVPHVIQGFKDRVNEVDSNVTDIRGHKTLLVKPQRRKSLSGGVLSETIKEAPVSALYLDTNMWRQMRDRFYKPDNIDGQTLLAVHVPQQPRSRFGLATPSERPSTPCSPSSRTRRKSDFPTHSVSAALPTSRLPSASGIFSKMAFAISYDDDLRKTSLAKAISANGGTLLVEDFHEMFEQQSTPTSPSRRAPQTEPFALNARFSAYGFAALITDRHSRKSKYMQALALGIPSLSGRWVEACIAAKTILDWQPYLLSSGESLELEGAVRSRILPPVDASTTLLKDLISARPNLLQGEAVIVLKGRGKAEAKRKPYIFLVKAAGAGRMKTCVDMRSAKAVLEGDSEDLFKWVFVDDKELGKAKVALLREGKGRESNGLRVVGNEFLCQSLILGRLWEQS